MNIYSTSVSGASMILGNDGLWYGMIAATKHGLGTDVYIVKAVHKDDTDISLENVLCAYKVDSSGNVYIFVDEPVSIRVTLANTSVSNSALGEGDDYADA